MNIAIAVKQTRKRNKIKQYVLAREVGITQTYLSQIESGKKIPSIEVLESICTYFNLPIPVLLWFGLSIDSIEPNKQELFLAIKPLFDALLESVFNLDM